MNFLENECFPWDNRRLWYSDQPPHTDGRLRWWGGGQGRGDLSWRLSTGHFCHTKALEQPSVISPTPCLLDSTVPSPSPSSLPSLVTAEGPLSWLVTASRWHDCTQFPLSACNSYPPGVILRNRLFSILPSNHSSSIFVGLPPRAGQHGMVATGKRHGTFLDTRILSYKNAYRHMGSPRFGESPLCWRGSVGKKVAKNYFSPFCAPSISTIEIIQQTLC